MLFFWFNIGHTNITPKAEGGETQESPRIRSVKAENKRNVLNDKGWTSEVFQFGLKWVLVGYIELFLQSKFQHLIRITCTFQNCFSEEMPQKK